jgi:hypothetical protein
MIKKTININQINPNTSFNSPIVNRTLKDLKRPAMRKMTSST